MIPGTSKKLSKSGPGTLRIITKMLQKIQENRWNHLGKILCLSICDIEIFENCRKSVCPRYQIVSMFFVRCCFGFLLDLLVFVWVYILKIILRRWGIENDTFSIIKQHPNLNFNFISIKKHEMDFTLNFPFSRNVP